MGQTRAGQCQWLRVKVATAPSTYSFTLNLTPLVVCSGVSVKVCHSFISHCLGDALRSCPHLPPTNTLPVHAYTRTTTHTVTLRVKTVDLSSYWSTNCMLSCSHNWVQEHVSCTLLVDNAVHKLPFHLHNSLPLKLHIDVVWLRSVWSDGEGKEGEEDSV